MMVQRKDRDIRVFLVDDHTVVREGLRAILEAQPDMMVVGEAAEGFAAIKSCLETKPDVIIMDISIPGLSGIEITRRVRGELPAVRVIILSMYSTSEHVHRALQAGAQGYLRKESCARQIIEAIRTVQAGGKYLGDHELEMVVSGFLSTPAAQKASPFERLSIREREIFSLVVEGKTSAEIAELLYLSPKTVDTYRSRLMKKMEVHDLPGLVKFAIQNGLTCVS